MSNINLGRFLTPSHLYLVGSLNMWKRCTLYAYDENAKDGLTHHTGRSREEIGTLHCHNLGDVFITALELFTSWIFGWDTFFLFSFALY